MAQMHRRHSPYREGAFTLDPCGEFETPGTALAEAVIPTLQTPPPQGTPGILQTSEPAPSRPPEDARNVARVVTIKINATAPYNALLRVPHPPRATAAIRDRLSREIACTCGPRTPRNDIADGEERRHPPADYPAPPRERPRKSAAVFWTPPPSPTHHSQLSHSCARFPRGLCCGLLRLISCPCFSITLQLAPSDEGGDVADDDLSKGEKKKREGGLTSN